MKFMNMKRFASTAMAGALALSLAVPAFAAGGQTVIAGTYEAIDLSVTVPATGKAIINPYGLPYKLNADNSVSGQQITTAAPLLIQNKSAVALVVTANLKGEASTGVTLEDNTASTDYTIETDKKLRVEFQAFEADGVDTNNATDMDVLIPKFIALEDGDAALKGDVTTTAGDATGNLVLREGKDGELQNGGAAFIRLSGEVAKKAEWATTDTFTATVAFTFEPGAYSKSAGEIDAGSVDLANFAAANSPATLSLTPALPTGVTATSTEWTSSDEACVKVTKNTADANKASLTHVAAGSAKITVTIEGSDGVTYITSVDVTAK